MRRVSPGLTWEMVRSIPFPRPTSQRQPSISCDSLSRSVVQVPNHLSQSRGDEARKLQKSGRTDSTRIGDRSDAAFNHLTFSADPSSCGSFPLGGSRIVHYKGGYRDG